MRHVARLTALLGVVASAAISAAAHADVTPHAGMLRYPDISKDKIVFLYANDLWVVDRDGGTAIPLASPPGAEGLPKFSDDGQTIAFVGNYEGGRDLYTLPVNGGIPKRVTHHPTTETLCGWTPDGDLLFFAGGIEGMPRASQIFTVDADGGLPQKLPVPYAAFGSISADGKWLAYTPYSREGRSWKRYRGGLATDIWLFNLETHEAKQITDWEGTDALPMWHGKKIYYLSDAGDEHRLNIWSYDVNSGKRKQVTTFSQYDVKWPSIGPGEHGLGEIVFQNGPALYVLDLNLGTSREVKVTIPGARPSLAKQRINASNFIQSWGISSTGKRAVAQARGDVWTLPAENGSPRNLTRTDGIAERTPSWSPDGRWIAYFSDETGEYELYVTQSDGKGETKQLTNDSKTFYQNIMWSPDSEHILYTDNAHNLFMYTLESGESRHIYKDPYGDAPQPSWSHDSSWIAYAKTDSDQPVSAIWLYHVEDGQHHKVTEGFFDDSSPAFDRKGDYLYFTSTRRFSPTYSDVDTSFIYDDSQVLIAVPLREDVESPWLLESDEETWKEDKPKEEDTDEKKSDEDAEDGDEKAGDDANGEGENDADDADDDANDDGDDEDATANPIVGDWEGTISGLTAMGAPEEMDSIPFTMTITENADGTLSGTSEAMGESDEFDEVTFDRSTNEFYARSVEEGFTSIMKGLLSDDSLEGSWEIVEMSVSGTWEASKIESEQDDEASEDNDEDDGDEEAEKDEKEQLKIDLENFESRAMMLPVGSGNFRNLAVNNRNHLLYVRIGKGVMSFDLSSGKKNEKTVAPGAFGFAISGDGKKILVPRGRAAMIQSSGGGSGDRVVTDNMTVRIDPRKEWEQLLVDAWRIHREFFYVENMHGVDWPAVLEQYRAMLDDCVTREDVSYLIREMIGELNVGHAYYFGGDTEGEPRINVGMLGVDWGYDDENDAYRIKKIHHGAPWDVDARSPFHPIGVDVKEGDYLLAVNGVEVDTSVDPWAPFIGTAGKTITMTVNDTPEMNDEARTVVIKPIGGEGRLRYRSWIEHNRQYVDEKTDGKIGYIYVPDTGVNGQNDLVRQYFGQIKKEGLIIDERWNGGGQIPTRFIEMLNRPVTNYWKRRDSKDWVWPPDAHHGPKCMLINGRAGSGGDMFPWLFRYNNLGKLIGTRTWGGLVGISGNPPLIDNGYTSVPTFGFYEKDGTWGIEGHGVDPDIRVVDDPSKMVDGGDPQLDAAIEHMLEQIEKNPYTRPDAPKPPDRSGMGIEEEDK